MNVLTEIWICLFFTLDSGTNQKWKCMQERECLSFPPEVNFSYPSGCFVPCENNLHPHRLKTTLEGTVLIRKMAFRERDKHFIVLMEGITRWTKLLGSWSP